MSSMMSNWRHDKRTRKELVEENWRLRKALRQIKELYYPAEIQRVAIAALEPEKLTDYERHCRDAQLGKWDG